MAICVVFLFLVYTATHLPLIAASGNSALGLSAELIHRDSPKSPFHDPNSTPSSRLRAAFERSAARAQYLSRATTLSASSSSSSSSSSSRVDLSSPIIPYHFEYLMSFSLGTPARKALAMVDTGSDLIWVQCEPCHECSKQKLPLFNPNASSTYSNISCRTDACSLLQRHSCDVNSLCQYEYPYVDGSFVSGLLSTETLSFFDEDQQADVRLGPEIIFGCTHVSEGNFNAVVGLGNGNLSLVRQLGSTVGNKFSYCLPSPYSSSFGGGGRLYLGPKSVVSSSGAVSTPLILGFPDTSYYLNLESISIDDGGALLDPIAVKPAPKQGSSQRGNIIIDSGAVLTYIDEEPLRSLVDKVMNNLSASHALARVNDTTGLFDLCFKYDGEASLKTIPLPEITFNFSGGAAVLLKQENAFVNFADERKLCLAITSNAKFEHLSFFGNLAQLNYLVGYDLDDGMVTFAPADCDN